VGLSAPLVFVLLLLGGMLAQLMLEAFTVPVGAASVWEPPQRAERAQTAMPTPGCVTRQGAAEL
jgi:hypothetical protein